jgi:hypothetical protein
MCTQIATCGESLISNGQRHFPTGADGRDLLALACNSH